MKRPRATSAPDIIFIIVLIVLVAAGFVMLASASSDKALRDFGDSYYFLKKQIINGFLIGFVGFITTAFVFYRKLAKFSLIFLLISLVFLILVFTPLGVHKLGASRWIDIAGFTFQPGEALKFTFILYLASWISNDKKRASSLFEGLLPFLMIVGVTTALLVMQPSTTIAAIILFAAGVTYFSGGAKMRLFIMAILIFFIAFGFLIFFSSYRYRIQRIMTFLNPNEADSLAAGYHRNQALIAIGSGGLWGVGYGKSTTKLSYLPEPYGDSIFAVLAEELGFIGSSILILLFVILIVRGFLIARQASDTLGKLLVVGFTSIIGIQAFVNIGAISGVLPLTGVPLPFISYGGTALAVFLTISGVIVNVSRYRR